MSCLAARALGALIDTSTYQSKPLLTSELLLSSILLQNEVEFNYSKSDTRNQVDYIRGVQLKPN